MPLLVGHRAVGVVDGLLQGSDDLGLGYGYRHLHLADVVAHLFPVVLQGVGDLVVGVHRLQVVTAVILTAVVQPALQIQIALVAGGVESDVHLTVVVSPEHPGPHGSIPRIRNQVTVKAITAIMVHIRFVLSISSSRCRRDMTKPQPAMVWTTADRGFVALNRPGGTPPTPSRGQASLTHASIISKTQQTHKGQVMDLACSEVSVLLRRSLTRVTSNLGSGLFGSYLDPEWVSPLRRTSTSMT